MEWRGGGGRIFVIQPVNYKCAVCSSLYEWMRLYTPPLYYVISVGKLLQFVPAVCTVNDVCITRIQIGARASAMGRGGGRGRPRIVRARTRGANSRIDRGRPPLVFKSNTLRVSTFINVYYHSMDNESPINYHAINGRAGHRRRKYRTGTGSAGFPFHSRPKPRPATIFPSFFSFDR